MSTEVEAHLTVRGHVQGVFYRASLKQQADMRQVRGWARNLPDGSVAAVLQGPPEAVDAVIAWARLGPRRAVVESAEVERSRVETPLAGFEVL